jgi:hypothetical protein
MQVVHHEASSARPHPVEPSSSNDLFTATGIGADASIQSTRTAATPHADSRIEGVVEVDRESPPHSAAARPMSPEEFPATPWEKWAEEKQNTEAQSSVCKDFDSVHHGDGICSMISLSDIVTGTIL